MCFNKAIDDSGIRLSAGIRQLLRALKATDKPGATDCLIQFENDLLHSLSQHLVEHPVWDKENWWVDFLFKSTFQIKLPNRVRWCSRVVGGKRIGEHTFFSEPFEFEMKLDPRSLQFKDYDFKFGSPATFDNEAASPKTESVQGKAFFFSFHCDAAFRQQAVIPPECIVDKTELRLLRDLLSREFNVSQDDNDAISVGGDEPSIVEPSLPEDVFLFHEERIAAQARQLFRAWEAPEDQPVRELSILYMRHCILQAFRRHLSKDSRWDKRARILESFKEGTVTVDLENRRLYFSEVAVWAEKTVPVLDTRGQPTGLLTTKPGVESRHCEPFEFALYLSPANGNFQKYVIRFGHCRSLLRKLHELRKDEAGQLIQQQEWEFFFHRERI